MILTRRAMGWLTPIVSLAGLAETIPKCTSTWDWDSLARGFTAARLQKVWLCHCITFSLPAGKIETWHCARLNKQTNRLAKMDWLAKMGWLVFYGQEDSENCRAQVFWRKIGLDHRRNWAISGDMKICLGSSPKSISRVNKVDILNSSITWNSEWTGIFSFVCIAGGYLLDSVLT